MQTGLQITETLKEVSISAKRQKEIDSFLHSLHDELLKIPDSSNEPLNSLSWLPPEVCLPFVCTPLKVKGNMQYFPPSDIQVIGSYQLQTCLKEGANVDLLLKIPKACMQAKDHLNQRYFRKRAAYLAHVGYYMSMNNLVSEVKFCYFTDDTLKPIVCITPSGSLCKFLTVKIHACPDEDSIKHARLHPLKSNVRKTWYDGIKCAEADERSLAPTPHYNSAILADLLMDSHLQHLHTTLKDCHGYIDAIKLLKVWLRQRELDQGYGSFSGFLISMVVALLSSLNKINKAMSSYQVVRNTFQYLATTDWSLKGGEWQNCDYVNVFHDHYEVVFIDPCGKLNLCANMSTLLYHQVRHEAELSLKALDFSQSGFNAVFMQSVPFLQKFDYLFQISKASAFQNACDKLDISDRVMDHGSNCITSSLPSIGRVLIKGLGDRIHLLGIKPHKYKAWKINDSPPTWKKTESNVTFGILLNASHAFDVLNKGPSADSEEAKSFREFWGDCSDLRRFKDGSICEAVFWKGEDASARRNIPLRVCKHILSRHCNISPSSFSFAATQLDMFLSFPLKPLKNGVTIGYNGTGEERSSEIMLAYNNLCEDLRSLKSLPLSITNLQGISPVLRFTEVIPPSCCQPNGKNPTISVNEEQIQVPVPDKSCPNFYPPIEVLCHMEGSGKWPQDVDALQRLKAAFHIAMADELKSNNEEIVCMPYQTYVDVLKDGYVFRVCVAYHREIGVLQTQKNKDGMVKIRNTSQSLALEKQTVYLPHLSSTIHGLCQKIPSYGLTCRLAKRWISSHLLSRQISTEAIELLVAFLFTDPQPYTVPSSAQSGFLRFLHLLATYDFASNSVIVDVNGSLTDEEKETITSHVSKHRDTLPAMCIMTPKDKMRSLWTSSGPSKLILRRLKDLAKIYQSLLEGKLFSTYMELKPVFTPSMTAYDVLIHLKSQWLPRRHESVSQVQNSMSSKHRAIADVTFDLRILPVVNFDPVQMYLDELEKSFSELAMFFYDSYGGSVIGVLWRVPEFQPKPFKISSVSGKMLNSEGKVVPNVEAIIEDFKTMGKGLVHSLDIRPDKWNI
ncbi:unnamed protein product [Clavelina lepadiformis]|uniref:Nucleolar protein 6 n=1 Tax=Clavelina lepadiformis TaxID=159417 RepID=A0ABP0GZA2_CLALP